MGSYRLVLNEKGEKRTYSLNDEVASIGRASDNTIPIKDTKSSRHHCQVSAENGEFFVSDLGSRNGTLLNKQQITRQQLEDGDVIQIGKTKIVFMSGGDGAPEATEGSRKSSKVRKQTKRRRKPVEPEPEPESGAEAEKAGDLALLDPDGDSGLSMEGDEADGGLLPGEDESYSLIWFRGADETEFIIRNATTTIGRLTSNTISLGDDDESVSGKHAQLIHAEGVFTLKDLGSTNGTKVNGITITEHTIKPGDLVEFGRTQFAFRNESFEQADELPTMGEMELPDYDLAVAPVYGSQGPPKFLLPFLGTLGGIILVIGGLAVWATRRSELPPPPVKVISGNLIGDYSFEVVAEEKPIGWKLSGDGIFVKSVDDAPSGKQVLVMTNEAGAEPILSASFDRTIKVQPLLNYQVKGQIRHTKGAGYAALRVQWLSTKDPYYLVEDYLGMLQAAGGWRKIEGIFKAPLRADRVRVACLVVGPATEAEFDHVLLFEVDKDGVENPEPLEVADGSATIDRSGLMTVMRGSSEQVFSHGRLQVVDDRGTVLYDQALLNLKGKKPVHDSNLLSVSGEMPHLQGGPALSLKITVSQHAQGLVLRYRLDGKKIDGASVRFVCSVNELDSVSAMAVETDGNFEMIRGEFVRPQVTLFTWQGKTRHLGLYPEKPAFVRYSKGTKVELSLFAPMTDQHQLSFRLRLNFAQDQKAMDSSFTKADGQSDAGRKGEAYKQYQQIIRTYPFIEGANRARKSVARIEKEASLGLIKLQRAFDRCRFFNRSQLLVGVRQQMANYLRRFEGMAIISKANALQEQVTNALTSARMRELEALASALLQRADDFRESKMNGLACTLYRRIVEQCQGTPQAERAAVALKELGCN